MNLDKAREEYKHYAVYISAQLFKFAEDNLEYSDIDFDAYVSVKDANDFRSAIKNYMACIDEMIPDIKDDKKKAEAIIVLDNLRKHGKDTFRQIEELRRWEEGEL